MRRVRIDLALCDQLLKIPALGESVQELASGLRFVREGRQPSWRSLCRRLGQSDEHHEQDCHDHPPWPSDSNGAKTTIFTVTDVQLAGGADASDQGIPGRSQPQSTAI